jgi:hypothetical protein
MQKVTNRAACPRFVTRTLIYMSLVKNHFLNPLIFHFEQVASHARVTEAPDMLAKMLDPPRSAPALRISFHHLAQRAPSLGPSPAARSTAAGSINRSRLDQPQPARSTAAGAINRSRC